MPLWSERKGRTARRILEGRKGKKGNKKGRGKRREEKKGGE
jgi:hypothetical protein